MCENALKAKKWNVKQGRQYESCTGMSDKRERTQDFRVKLNDRNQTLKGSNETAHGQAHQGQLIFRVGF